MRLLRSVEGMDEVLDGAIKRSQDLADRNTMIDGFADKYIGWTIAIIEAEQDDDQALATAQEWIDDEFEVALDSGSTDNVCHPEDAPGYVVEASQGSRRGQKFVVGDGNKISNDGEVRLNLQTIEDSPNDIGSTLQVAKVSRPLMSVGKICDHGMKVRFSSDKAEVMKGAAAVCTFEMIHQGLCLAKLRQKRPDAPFGRQG